MVAAKDYVLAEAAGPFLAALDSLFIIRSAMIRPISAFWLLSMLVPALAFAATASCAAALPLSPD